MWHQTQLPLSNPSGRTKPWWIVTYFTGANAKHKRGLPDRQVRRSAPIQRSGLIMQLHQNNSACQVREEITVISTQKHQEFIHVLPAATQMLRLRLLGADEKKLPLRTCDWCGVDESESSISEGLCEKCEAKNFRDWRY